MYSTTTTSISVNVSNTLGGLIIKIIIKPLEIWHIIMHVHTISCILISGKWCATMNRQGFEHNSTGLCKM